MRFPQFVDKFVTHPNNKEALLNALGFTSNIARPEEKPFPLTELNGIPIEFSEHVPERDLVKEWEPPASDGYCEYGPEDEAWMRPLGLGTIKTVDRGAAFFVAGNNYQLAANSPYFKRESPQFYEIPKFDYMPIRTMW